MFELQITFKVVPTQIARYTIENEVTSAIRHFDQPSVNVHTGVCKHKNFPFPFEGFMVNHNKEIIRTDHLSN